MISLLTIGMPWQSAILAGGVGLLAALAAAESFARLRQTSGRARAMWIAVGAVIVLCAAVAVDLVAERASGIAPIAAGAAIGLGLGGGLYWLAAANGAQQDLRDAALSYMTQGLCMFDGPGRLVFWNKRFAEIYRIEGRLRIGFSLRDILRERDGRRHLGRGPGRICPPRHGGGPRRQEIHPRVRAVRRAQDRGQQRAAAERRLGVDA